MIKIREGPPVTFILGVLPRERPRSTDFRMKLHDILSSDVTCVVESREKKIQLCFVARSERMFSQLAAQAINALYCVRIF